MKIRHSFVSNSSTTSFTCCISGHVESGWDSSSLEYFGFCECENGHIFLEKFVSLNEDEKQEIKIMQRELAIAQLKEDGDPEPYDDDLIEDVINECELNKLPAKYCPVCNRTYVTDKELLNYVYFHYKTDKDSLLQQYQNDSSYQIK